VKRSIEILKACKVTYEFRMTVVPEIVNAEDIPAIGELVKGAKVLALQQFVANDTLDRRFTTLKSYSPEVIAGFADTLRGYVETVKLRL